MIPRNRALIQSQKIVPYLSIQEVRELADQALKGRHGARDSLLVHLLFQSGLRISEALSLTPNHIQKFEGRAILSIIGKGRKPRLVSIPEPLADKMKSYAWEKKLSTQDRFFPFGRDMGWLIIKKASQKAGFNKNVFPHLLRHSAAIFRLRQTDPKSLQIFLGHSSLHMTMRYLVTLTAEDALRIQSEVKFDD
jgi:integrase/recombinase XerD